MAEEKHRMLFQDQDPGQDLQKQRPMSLSPSEPPTYDDAMQTSAIQESLNYSTDRRRTFFAEPQHLRSRVEEMPLHQMEVEVSVQSEGLAMPPLVLLRLLVSVSMEWLPDNESLLLRLRDLPGRTLSAELLLPAAVVRKYPAVSQPGIRPLIVKVFRVCE
ncbi:GM11410 [Drosophila sechellia]|uniref:GM11410 n=1 Tax=Drosophila sechellia TaxID=7238 RepID=B4IDM5_DROSE|nr:GM11410 [Drosophila sechellia]